MRCSALVILLPAFAAAAPGLLPPLGPILGIGPISIPPLIGDAPAQPDVPAPVTPVQPSIAAPQTCIQCSAQGDAACHSTASCISVPGSSSPSYCACRAGYKAASADALAGTNTQFRLPWDSQQGRVFVAPGVACDTLCSNSDDGVNACKEVRNVGQTCM